jgi:hypothetical protein
MNNAWIAAPGHFSAGVKRQANLQSNDCRHRRTVLGAPPIQPLLTKAQFPCPMKAM